MMKKISIYDMDRTITIRGTYTPFLFHMLFARAPWRLIFMPLLPFGFIAYGLKLISREALKTYNQRLLLGSRVSIAKITPHIERYADKVMRSNSYAKAIKQIEADRAEGRQLVLATASYEIYVNAIAERLGFDNVIATRLEINEQGQVLPKIIDNNCYDDAKLDRIKTFLDEQRLTRDAIHIRAYSDHITDVPMLEYADEAVATTPSLPLRLLAKKRNWKILDWN